MLAPAGDRPELALEGVGALELESPEGGVQVDHTSGANTSSPTSRVSKHRLKAVLNRSTVARSTVGSSCWLVMVTSRLGGGHVPVDANRTDARSSGRIDRNAPPGAGGSWSTSTTPRPPGRLSSDQTVLVGIGGGGRAGRQVQLGEDVLEVVVTVCSLISSSAAMRRFVPPPATEPQHLALPGRQPGGRHGPRGTAAGQDPAQGDPRPRWVKAAQAPSSSSSAASSSPSARRPTPPAPLGPGRGPVGHSPSRRHSSHRPPQRGQGAPRIALGQQHRAGGVGRHGVQQRGVDARPPGATSSSLAVRAAATSPAAR